MKKFIRKTRLVLACMSLAGGIFRLLAALVDVAFNYLYCIDSKMVTSLRDQERALGIRALS